MPTSPLLPRQAPRDYEHPLKLKLLAAAIDQILIVINNFPQLFYKI